MTDADPWEFRRQDYSLDGDQQDVRDAFSEFFRKGMPELGSSGR